MVKIIIYVHILSKKKERNWPRVAVSVEVHVRCTHISWPLGGSVMPCYMLVWPLAYSVEIIESSKNAFDVFTNLKTAKGLKWMCIFLIMDAIEDQLWQIVLFITVSLDCSFNVCNLQNPEHHHLSFYWV